MKNLRVSFWLRTAGLMSALIFLLIGASSCKNRQVTKYGPPNQYQDDGAVTKYGAPPVDNGETITKYGVPMPDSLMTPDAN